MYTHHDNDAIMLVKQFVSSESLAQPPTTILPLAFQKRLTEPLEQLPRNLLSEKAKKEFLDNQKNISL